MVSGLNYKFKIGSKIDSKISTIINLRWDPMISEVLEKLDFKIVKLKRNDEDLVISKNVLKSNAAWTIFGQQVLMAKLKFPDISKMLKTEEIPNFLKPYLQKVSFFLFIYPNEFFLKKNNLFTEKQQ